MRIFFPLIQWYHLHGGIANFTQEAVDDRAAQQDVPARPRLLGVRQIQE